MSDEELHPFVETVIEARKRYQLTQRQLAELAGISQSSISDMERGKLDLFRRLGNFQKVMKVFGYELEVVENGLTDEQVTAIADVLRAS